MKKKLVSTLLLFLNLLPFTQASTDIITAEGKTFSLAHHEPIHIKGNHQYMAINGYYWKFLDPHERIKQTQATLTEFFNGSAIYHLKQYKRDKSNELKRKKWTIVNLDIQNKPYLITAYRIEGNVIYTTLLNPIKKGHYIWVYNFDAVYDNTPESNYLAKEFALAELNRLVKLLENSTYPDIQDLPREEQ